ncbi:hypothetical protein D3C72_2071110 [compost metagenome]
MAERCSASSDFPSFPETNPTAALVKKPAPLKMVLFIIMGRSKDMAVLLMFSFSSALNKLLGVAYFLISAPKVN